MVCALRNMAEDFAEEFPVISKVHYLNTAGIGLTPKSVIEAMNRFSEEVLRTPPYRKLFDEYGKMVEEARREFGRLIGASSKEVSFHLNTSEAVNLVVEMLKPKRGENVVVDDLGYPSNVYPLMALRNKGVKVRIIGSRKGLLGVEDYERVVDENTKLVMVSFVSFVNGLRSDVEGIGKLADERGAYFMVDSTHGTGYLKIDVKRWRADFLATSNYKWLLSPFGAAELYCTKECLEELSPPHVGWHSVEGPTGALNTEGYTIAKDSRRFEPGNLGYISIKGLKESLNFLSGVGFHELQKATLKLAGEILDGLFDMGADLLTPMDEGRRSGIVFASFRGLRGEDIVKHLMKKKVWVTPRRFMKVSGIRISPYFYNNEEDIERFLRELRGIFKG